MKKLIASLYMVALATFVSAQMFPKKVLLEHFTQASCPPCATYNPAIEAIVQDPNNAAKIVAIKYQTAFPGVDPMNAHNPTEVASRVTLYSPPGVPNSVLDGNAYNGHPASFNQGMLDGRAGVMSPFQITAKALYNIDSTSLDVEVEIEAGATVNGNLVAHIAIVEEHINFATAPGTNGETDFYDVMKKFLPSDAGTPLSSSWVAGNTATITESWTTSNVYDKSTLAVVIWIQNTTTNEVLQSHKEKFTAEAPPVANFIADNIYISPGSTVNFTDRSAFFPTGWNWNFDVNGLGGITPTTSTAQNPSATFTNYGDYDIQLIATNALGTDTVVKSAYVHVIDCQDIAFDIQMDDFASTISWEVTNDSSGEVLRTGQGYPNVAGGQLINESLCLGEGCYTFRMYDTGGNGICCVSGNGSYTITNNSTSTVLGTGGSFTFADSLQFCVSSATVAPVASFAASDTTICAFNEIRYSDLSTNTATAWDWSFPGGTPSTSTFKNPIISYTTPGTYPVTFKAYNNVGGDSTTINSFITVNPGPSVDAGADVDFCSNTAGGITLSGTIGSLATGVQWSTIHNGTIQNPTSLTPLYTPSTLDFNRGYSILKITSTGNGTCPAATDQIRITYTQAPEVDAGTNLRTCEIDTSIFLTGIVTNSTGGMWSGGNGTFINPATLSTYYEFDAADVTNGSIVLRLTSTGNGVCPADEDSIIITFDRLPTAEAGVDQEVCSDNNFVLGGASTNATGVEWSTAGTGSFIPSKLVEDPIYIPSDDDKANGAVVFYMSTRSNGNCPPAMDSVTVAIKICNGIESSILDSKVNIYPNPTSDVVYINSDDLEVLGVSIVNTLGETLKAYSYSNSVGTLSVADLPRGSYILNITTNEGMLYKSLTIQR